jgi:hypothetical protein
MESDMNIDQLHGKARHAIASGESKLREAAEYLAMARGLGASQRQSAKAIGKSVAWVNLLLKWRDRGFKETPFGPQSKAKRTAEHARRTAVAKATKQPTGAERVARLEFQRARAEAVAKMFGPSVKTIPDDARALLVKALRALASDRAAERASAALIVENQRARLNMSWEELLVPAADSLDVAA